MWGQDLCNKNSYVWLIQNCQWISKSSASMMLKNTQRNLEQFTVAQFLLPLKTISCAIRNREVFFQKNIAPKVLSYARHSVVVLYLPKGKALFTSGSLSGHLNRGGSQNLTGSKTQVPSTSLAETRSVTVWRR